MNESAIDTSHEDILAYYQIRAKKSFGQNFLTDDFFLDQIANATDLGGAHVVEIGPGYGALTSKILSKHPSSATLVELDPDMVRILRDRANRSDAYRLA